MFASECAKPDAQHSYVRKVEQYATLCFYQCAVHCYCEQYCYFMCCDVLRCTGRTVLGLLRVRCAGQHWLDAWMPQCAVHSVQSAPNIRDPRALYPRDARLAVPCRWHVVTRTRWCVLRAESCSRLGATRTGNLGWVIPQTCLRLGGSQTCR